MPLRRLVPGPEQPADRGSHPFQGSQRRSALLLWHSLFAIPGEVRIEHVWLAHDVGAAKIFVIKGDGAPAIHRKKGRHLQHGAPVALKTQAYGPCSQVVD